MRTFYKTQLGIDLSWSDCLPIFSRGHIFNIFGDLITITGTIMKIILDYSSCLLVSVLPYGGHVTTSLPIQQTPSSSIQTSMVRILLGTGILLQAAVMLRFVSYFQQFNVSEPYSLKFLPLLKSPSEGSLQSSKNSCSSAGQVHFMCPATVLGLHDVWMVGPESIPL